MTKVCNTCKEEKPIESFSIVNKAGNRRAYCKSCRNAKRKAVTRGNKSVAEDTKAREKKWREANKEKIRQYQRTYKWKNVWGIDPVQAKQLWDNHNGKCAICGSTDRTFVLDHCHTKLIGRDILCQQCNSLIGMAGESIDVLRSAIDYLKRHNQ